MRVALVVALLSGMVTVSSCAGDIEPTALQQETRISLRGAGRDVDAEFRFLCVLQASPLPEAAVYRPSASGLLHIAPNRQGLVGTAVGKDSDTLCSPDPRAATDPEWQKVPLLIWIDNVDRPAMIDVVEAASLQAHRKYRNYPPLTDYSFGSSPTLATEIKYQKRTIPVADDIRTILGNRSGKSIRLISPLVLRASVRLTSASARAEFEKILGPTISPGVRSVNLCALKHSPDGEAFFSKRGTPLDKCSSADTASSALPKNSIQFSLSRPALNLASGHWSFADPIGSAASYVRSDNVQVKNIRKMDFIVEANSTEFWLKSVQKVSIKTTSGAEIDIPAGNNSGYYMDDSNILYLMLGDVEILYFNPPLEWSEQ
ncbi:hypothetical protein OVY29_16965 [Sphingopyxis sp. SE2]|uniref:hypothetical protein n=1 Tax=Sphingopyxis sp. SE2 TaxID=1586240 RepID=UPI0028C00A56|nr:hypothetical protein [Sphingopyxis sp. SE2]MDT7530352.1 hypothetical protein [Sphingopyxis sp. SE2]